MFTGKRGGGKLLLRGKESYSLLGKGPPGAIE